MTIWSLRHSTTIPLPDRDYFGKCLEVGTHISCVITEDDMLDCWSDIDDLEIPQVKVKKVVSNYAHACVVTMDDEVKCFGHISDWNN